MKIEDTCRNIIIHKDKTNDFSTRYLEFWLFAGTHAPTIAEKLLIAVEALKEIERRTDELRLNSGHMYLAAINYVVDEAKEALEKIGWAE